MKYKTAFDIYVEEVKNKGRYIPRLNFQEEVHFQLLNATITELAIELNLHANWEQFFMFRTKKQYWDLVEDMKAFMNFWSFLDGKEILITHLGKEMGDM